MAHMEEKITFLRPIEFPGVETMSVRNSTRLWRIFHETYAVCTVLTQSNQYAEWTYRRGHHKAASGELMLMEPGEMHVTKRNHGIGKFEVLEVSSEVIGSIAMENRLASNP